MQYGFLLQQVAAVEGEQQVVPFPQAEAGEPHGLHQAVAVETDGVN